MRDVDEASDSHVQDVMDLGSHWVTFLLGQGLLE